MFLLPYGKGVACMIAHNTKLMIERCLSQSMPSLTVKVNVHFSDAVKRRYNSIQNFPFCFCFITE